MIVQGMSGVMSITGEPDRPPARVGTSISDLSAAMFTVTGVLAALHERERTDRGQMVDVAMLDSVVALMENAIARYGVTGEPPHALGARHPSITPFELFESKDGHVVLAIGNDAIWERFLSAIDEPELRDATFATNPERTENYAALEPVLKEIMRGRTTAEWTELLDAAGVPCGPYHHVGQMVEHEQIRARGMVERVAQEGAGEFLVAGAPVKFTHQGGQSSVDCPKPESDGRGQSTEDSPRPAPRLGEHTDEVLRDLLGYTPDQIEQLRDDGAL